MSKEEKMAVMEEMKKEASGADGEGKPRMPDSVTMHYKYESLLDKANTSNMARNYIAASR